MDRRERIEAALFHALASLLCLAWWIGMARAPQVRAAFLGAGLAEHAPFLLLVPDLLALVAGGAWLAFAILRSRREAPALAWAHFGAAGYGWAIALVLALEDPRAYPGWLGMSLFVSVAFLVALRISDRSLLWGPFRFRTARPASHAALRRDCVVQTLVMWTVFLGLLPILLALVEHFLGWRAYRIDAAALRWIGVACMVAGGALGLCASAAMVREGAGTPLPASCATRLVVSGPYRHVRNPMATGSLLQGFGVALAIGSPVALVYALAGVAAWELLVRHEEETWLRQQFGAAFDDYRRRVRCWWPRLRPYLPPESG